MEEREENEGGNVAIRLPGVKSGDMASRKLKPEVRVYYLQFSPTGKINFLIRIVVNYKKQSAIHNFCLFYAAQAWAAATTEGLLIYSLDVGFVFDRSVSIGIRNYTRHC